MRKAFYPSPQAMRMAEEIERQRTATPATVGESLSTATLQLADDPEHQAREQADLSAPVSEILDAPPLECVQPAQTRQHAEAHALALGFGTRAPRLLRPARQDDLFNPMSQRRLF